MNDDQGGFAIDVRGLVKSYGRIEAVRGIDFAVDRGEVFGFLGPNGAGKSTTIGVLCTMIRSTSGQVRVTGLDVTRDPDAVRGRIGIVFQDPSLDDQLTARENLRFHSVLYGVPRAEQRGRIDGVLDLVDLRDRAADQVRTFSGGMKRRLEIARGMLHHPQVLFLDEPTLGLDPQTRKGIWEHLQELRRREGVTLFMTTHYMDEAELCDRIAIIDRGELVVVGTPAELKATVGGSVITIGAEDPAAVAREVELVSGATPVVERDGVRVEVDDAGAVLPRLIREVTTPIGAVTLNRPSLDDVFLKLTGHTMRDEQGGALDQMRMMAGRWSRAGGRR